MKSVLTPNDFPGELKKGSSCKQDYYPYPDLSPSQYLVVLDKLEEIADNMSEYSLPKCYCCVDDVMALFDWNGSYADAICIGDPYNFGDTVCDLVGKAEEKALKTQLIEKSIGIIDRMVKLYASAEKRGCKTHSYNSFSLNLKKTKLEGLLK